MRSERRTSASRGERTILEPTLISAQLFFLSRVPDLKHKLGRTSLAYTPARILPTRSGRGKM